MGSLALFDIWSFWLRAAAISAYAAAFFSYAARLAVQKLKLDRGATLLAATGVTIHTGYLLTRWLAAGQLEIQARLQGGDVLSSYDRFWFLISHPPYTNLYDALNFVAWALMVGYLVIERRWGLRVVGTVAVALALVAMGEAALVADKQIEPLVPALQSYWILIHVGMLFVSYALFTLGAICALLYLVRTGARTASLGLSQAAAAAVLLALVGGKALLFGGAFEMAPGWIRKVPSRLHPGKMLDVVTAAHYFPVGSEKAAKVMVPVPGVGIPLLVALMLFAAAAAFFWIERRKTAPVMLKSPTAVLPDLGSARSSWGVRLTLAAFVALTLSLAVLAARIAQGGELQLPAGLQLAPGETGPFRFSFGSNYAMGLIALIWGSTLGFLFTAAFRSRIAEGLPDARKLEDITYRVITVGWPLLTVGIVMGGMWANEAWGRFWGWDPKETWALITWVVYAGYLHTRITLGWAGRKPATIAVFAFAVVIFTFMGVNLGLTGDGLHTYGAG